ncbi:MAG: clan AA aspartic protease [Phycisphaerae bacterium]|nr:clan AA aspartic protease [Phycisphaerae bacterium]
MISGRVTTGLEAVVSLRIRAPSGAERDCDAIIDTGFDGFVALPAHLVDELQLRPVGSLWAILGDGQATELMLFHGTVVWEAGPRRVDVLAIEGGALVGMALLRTFRLTVDVMPGGRVTVEPLQV